MTRRVQESRRGFTLVELLVAMVLGVMVLGAALSFVRSVWRSTGGSAVREDVNRNARFIGMTLERDLMQTGAGIFSTVGFGTLATWNDTIVMLMVPADSTGTVAPVHNLVVPAADTGNPLPAGGTCGTYCINLTFSPGGGFDLVPGSLARLQVNNTIHLILVVGTTNAGTSEAVTFLNDSTLLHYPAGLTRGLRLDRFSTTVEGLGVIAYWTVGTQLMRAAAFNIDGTLKGTTEAYGMQQFHDSLAFVNGHLAPHADTTGTDTTSTFDKVRGLVVNAQLQAAAPDPRLNNGALFTRSYRWQFSPRNLMWQHDNP